MNITMTKNYKKYRNLLHECQADCLIKYLDCCYRLDCPIYPEDTIVLYILDLYDVSLKLDDEEAETMGLSKTAHELRKEWRSNYREIKHRLKAISRNHFQFFKEWSKPRTQYIFDATGEVHNGLWYTLKAAVSLKHYGVDSVRFRKRCDATSKKEA